MRDSSPRFPFLLLLIFLLPLFYSCKSKEEKEESLAKSYCGSCHLYPDPSLLDKKTWETSVLPMMSFHMGFSEPEIMAKIPDEDLMIILRALPRRPMVKDDEWSMIKNFYLNHAPDSLTVDQKIIEDSIAQFHIRPIQLLPEQLITLIKIDTSSQLMYLGERLSRLYKLNSHLTMVDTAYLPSPPSWISTDDKAELVTTMGIMDPNDQALGQLVSLDDLSHPILDSLKRPVYFEPADFNADNAIDYVVCSFGNFIGDLSVYEATENGYQKHVVNPLPGARKTIVRDFTNDNKPDILALTAQGDEQIVLVVNNGAFQFRKKVLLRFPPVYGTSYFEIADFNNDGFFDILIANGDNADYSRIVKPYHGIRIFENDGNDNFNEVWYYPMPGATMAMTKDFDQDGDLDIIGLSFFPDFKTAPEKSLIYFQRENGDYRFTPQVTTFANRSRWLVMETGDYDVDGDCDIIVGALNLKGSGASQADYENWVQNKTTLLVFVNKLVDK